MTYTCVPLNPNFLDINPITGGVAFASARNGCPYRKLGYTLIHYVSKGSGFLHIDGDTYPVSAGEAFIIPAGHVANYKSSPDDPWEYRWVGFTGTLSHSFESFPRVLPLPSDFLEILHTTKLPDMPRKQLEYQLAADLFSLYARLSSDLPDHVDNTAQCVHDVADYIQINFNQKLSVEAIALHFNYDRTYLCKQFKKRMGCSIQQYILDVRLQKAMWMLENDIMIKEVAASCGFSDVSNFSKVFARQVYMTPTEFKQMVQNNYEAFRNNGAE